MGINRIFNGNNNFMNERYLHFLWQTKRLPFHLLKTIDQKEVRILQIGIYNEGSGPDFFNGKIEIDGVQLGGNIEMHVKSSDWYVHGHQHDRAYDNVILHIVYEHDRLVFIEGVEVPTVELKQFIDIPHFQHYNELTEKRNAIVCEQQWKTIPAPIIWDQVEKAALHRLKRKTEDLKNCARLIGNDPRKVLFHSMASAFGMKTNRLPFMELATRIPFERMLRAEKTQIEAVVFGTGGLLQERNPDPYRRELQNEWFYQSELLAIEPCRKHTWQFKGCRPSGFPTLRLAQFASFFHQMNWSSSFWELPAMEIRNLLEQALTTEPSPYWLSHYDFGKERKKVLSAAMTLNVAQVVIVNGVIPFLWWLSDFTQQSIYREKSLEILEMLNPENNRFIEIWKKKQLIPKSAFETQGLIELKNEFCEKKNCLNCKIGIYLLGR